MVRALLAAARFLDHLARRLRSAIARARGRGRDYGDDVVRLDDEGLTILAYYWPIGRKRITYDRIRRYDTFALTMGRGQYRVRGIDLAGRWYSRDPRRSSKELAIVLDTGRRIRPVVTPTDPDTVLSILAERVGPQPPPDVG